MDTIKTMGRAVIYCRTATMEQNRKSGIIAQEKICLKIAKKQGYKILDVLKDKGRGGHNLKRPGIRKLLKMIKNKRIDAVFTTDSARLSRNITDYLYLKKIFNQNKIDFFPIFQPQLIVSNKNLKPIIRSIKSFVRSFTQINNH